MPGIALSRSSRALLRERAFSPLATHISMWIPAASRTYEANGRSGLPAQYEARSSSAFGSTVLMDKNMEP